MRSRSSHGSEFTGPSGQMFRGTARLLPRQHHLASSPPAECESRGTSWRWAFLRGTFTCDPPSSGPGHGCPRGYLWPQCVLGYAGQRLCPEGHPTNPATGKASRKGRVRGEVSDAFPRQPRGACRRHRRGHSCICKHAAQPRGFLTGSNVLGGHLERNAAIVAGGPHRSQSPREREPLLYDTEWHRARLCVCVCF